MTQIDGIRRARRPKKEGPESKHRHPSAPLRRLPRRARPRDADADARRRPGALSLPRQPRRVGGAGVAKGRRGRAHGHIGSFSGRASDDATPSSALSRLYSLLSCSPRLQSSHRSSCTASRRSRRQPPPSPRNFRARTPLTTARSRRRSRRVGGAGVATGRRAGRDLAVPNGSHITSTQLASVAARAA